MAEASPMIDSMATSPVERRVVSSLEAEGHAIGWIKTLNPSDSGETGDSIKVAIQQEEAGTDANDIQQTALPGRENINRTQRKTGHFSADAISSSET